MLLCYTYFVRYGQFDIVIAGLDNIEARQWLNQMLVSLVRYDSEGEIDIDSVIPFIDGGTEAFGGQARVFLPRLTSCFECSLASMQPQTGFAVCTIRNVPRIPEHWYIYYTHTLPSCFHQHRYPYSTRSI